MEQLHLENNPLKEEQTNRDIFTRALTDLQDLNDDESRYVFEWLLLREMRKGEKKAESAALGRALGGLIGFLIDKVNAVNQEEAAYATFSEFYKGEKDRKKNRTYKYTGNIQKAHEQLAELKKSKHNEDTKLHNFLAAVFCLVFTALMGSVTYYGFFSDDFTLMDKIGRTGFSLLSSPLGIILFFVAVFVLYFFVFRYWLLALGTPLALWGLCGLLHSFPGVMAKVLGVLCGLAALFLLLLAYQSVHDLITLKNPTQAELAENAEIQRVYDGLYNELKEYTQEMLKALDEVHSRALANDSELREGIEQYIESSGYLSMSDMATMVEVAQGFYKGAAKV